MKGFSLFQADKVVHFSVTKLVDFFTDGVADLIPEKLVYPAGYLHRLSVLVPVFELFPTDEATYSHDGPGQSSARFPSPHDPPGESASGFEDLRASNLQLFLQSCKNGLGSPEIGHVIMEGEFEDVLQKLFFIHVPSPFSPMPAEINIGISEKGPFRQGGNAKSGKRACGRANGGVNRPLLESEESVKNPGTVQY